MRKYGKLEFCKAVKCQGLRINIDGEYGYCAYSASNCLKTAKEFHVWLEQNMFVISAPENEYEASDL